MVAFYLHVMNAIAERREQGQGTVEYVGIAVVITVIIAGVVAVLGESNIYDEIDQVISDVIDDIASGIDGA